MKDTLSVQAADSLPPGDSFKERGLARFLMSQWVLAPVFLVIFVACWHGAVKQFEIQSFVLPSPFSVAAELANLVRSSFFWQDALTTATETFVGYGMSVVSALALGLAIAQVRIVEKMLLPYIVAFQAVPKTALAPVFLIWFGFGLTSKIVAAALSAFFPILINVVVGLKSSDRDRVAMLRSLGASSWQTFRYVELPNAMPFIFAGLKVGVVGALIGAVVGEFVGAQAGLGYRILQMNFQFNIAGVFAIMVALSMLGLIPYYILHFIQRRYVFWGDSSEVTVT